MIIKPKTGKEFSRNCDQSSANQFLSEFQPKRTLAYNPTVNCQIEQLSTVRLGTNVVATKKKTPLFSLAHFVSTDDKANSTQKKKEKQKNCSGFCEFDVRTKNTFALNTPLIWAIIWLELLHRKFIPSNII